MNHVDITSNFGHIHIGYFYVGWNNNPSPSVNGDCGDETFGLGIANFYVGRYSDGKWCAGFLNKYGCLE